ncbi:FAD dependent oxidoreductase [Lophiostoma macrostomum CBS 122681]|uniref:FAD dependent oxidoreductase n=1 Tax=Lophiostoma macrostomum CBS 122681 TaxID=1314788 RepID=A0A6A6STD1_9PLEO|nr:FAD dependent oxidoreductase [Lophiostoma macrostomum CBS 122681]
MATVQSPMLPTHTDFAVIGSGITGCSVTKALLEHAQFQGSTVTVLEARTLVSGATSRNGGHLVSAAGHTYAELARRYGMENAKQITRFSIMNIDYVLSMIRGLDKDVQEQSQVREVVKVMAALDEGLWKDAVASLKAFQAAVPEYKSYHTIVEADEVERRWNVRGAAGAIEHAAGAVWPYRLLTGIFERMQEAHSERLSIETNTPVLKVDWDANSKDYPYTLTTPRGRLRAKTIVHCTNAHAAHLLKPLQGKLYGFRGTMTVQKAGPRLPNEGRARSWSAMYGPSLDLSTGVYDTGLVYLQQNALTGDIWVGTETSKITDILKADDTFVAEEAKDKLSTFLSGYFAQGWDSGASGELEGIWTGVQGHTADGLPMVGKLPPAATGRKGSDAEWIAAGFNGYGMDKCWLTGNALVRMVAGENVTEWFPQCYMMSEARFRQDMTLDRVLAKFANIAQGGRW